MAKHGIKLLQDIDLVLQQVLGNAHHLGQFRHLLGALGKKLVQRRI
jgi:hypothetical protein